MPYLRKFVIVFLVDILILCKNWKNHLEYIRTVLQTVRKNNWFCKMSKCDFGVKDNLLLGHRINGHFISPDPKKLESVKVWPTPTTITEVKQFLGFPNYFRQFIDHFSAISHSLEEITGKHAKFEWTKSRQHAFETLQLAVLSSPVLQRADVHKPLRIASGASDFAITAVLLQEDDQKDDWHPVAYCSRKLLHAEQNYTAAEREIMAVVFALKAWRIYLSSMADALSRRPDFREDETSSALAFPKPEINAIEFALELHNDIAKSVSEAYHQYKELFPIIQKMKAEPGDNLHELYYLDAESGHFFSKQLLPIDYAYRSAMYLRLRLIQRVS